MPPLHWHMPAAQPLAAMPQSTQVLCEPHWLAEPPDTHRLGVAELQQPAQVAASQAQAPVAGLQISPGLHCGLLPHLHRFPAHALDRCGSHVGAHGPINVAHCGNVSVTQVEPEQQPLQVSGLHDEPPMHRPVAGLQVPPEVVQSAQLLPLIPQALLTEGLTQLPAVLQQPLAQLAAVHLQAPPTHSRPLPQAAAPPQ
jgi:hypothetical protein